MKIWDNFKSHAPDVSAASGIPPEIWRKIVAHLAPLEQAQVRAVSRTLRGVVEGECGGALDEQRALLPADTQAKLSDAPATRRASIALRYHESFVPAPWVPLGWVADAHLVRAPWGAQRPNWRHDVLEKPLGTPLASVCGWRPSGWRAACAGQRRRRRQYGKAQEALTPLRRANEPSIGALGLRSDALRLSGLEPYHAGRPVITANAPAMMDDAWPFGAYVVSFVWDVTRPYILAIVAAEPTWNTSPTFYFGIWEARYPMARENITSQAGAMPSHICVDAGVVDFCPSRGALRVMPEGIEVLLAESHDGQVHRFSLAMPVFLLLSADARTPGQARIRQDHPLRGHVENLII